MSPHKSTTRPIIATLMIDRASQDSFQKLRHRYYPQSKTPAHVTLFRHLPGAEPDVVKATVEQLCAQTPPFTLEATHPESLANGVALPLNSEALLTLRGQIAAAFQEHLRPDDKKPFSPHMTIVNRVTRRRAQRILGTVRAQFTPLTAYAGGVALWFYTSGRWESLAECLFHDA